MSLNIISNSPVCFLMGFTGCWVRESLVAVPTAERLLSRVNTHVSLEITSVGEFLPTVLERRKYVMKSELANIFMPRFICKYTNICTKTPSVTRISMFRADISALMPQHTASGKTAECAWGCLALL